MRQQHMTHPIGTFSRCGGCQREPKHIASYGTNSREPLLGTNGNSERHHLECHPCCRRTAKHTSLDTASKEWTAAFADNARGLRAIATERDALPRRAAERIR